MLATSNCYKHHLGIHQPDGTEMTERNHCEAFLDKIPDDISYGGNKHLKLIKDQENDIVFEKGKFVWEQEGYRSPIGKLEI